MLPVAPVHRRPRLTRKASSEPWSAEPAGAAKPTSVPHARVTVRHYHLHGAQVRLRRLLRGAQQARSAPRTNVRELFCGSKITRNDSDEAERRERSPSGVVSAANVEELTGAARQVSGKAALANASASQVNGSSEASGEVRRASGPPEPSA